MPAVPKALAMAGVAGILYYLFQQVVWAAVVAGLALFVLISGVLFPAVYRAFDNTVLKGARLIGTVLTWILLVPFFYLCFVPGRLVLLLRGIDPLDRKIDRGRSSYWISYRGSRDLHRYKRQY